MSLYRLENVTRRYGDKTVLRIDDLALEPGGVFGIVGPNGSGKSTLMRLLALIEQPTTGALSYRGADARQAPLHVKREVAMVMAQPFLLSRNVFENIAYGLRLRGDTDRLKERTAEVMDMVGLHPQKFLHRSWRELSGGEAQRVCVAARLVLRPSVLLMDEPTSSLDFASHGILKDVIRTVSREWGTTVILSSHDAGWLYDLSGRILKLHRGRMVDFPPENILSRGWKAEPDGRYSRDTGDGQRLVAPPPPTGKAHAVISTEVLRFADEDERAGPDCNIIDAVIVSLRRSVGGAVDVEVMAGDVSLRLQTDTDEAVRRGLVPGVRARVAFPVDAVWWHEYRAR